MSWDVLVLNYHGSPPAGVEEMASASNPDPLGKVAAVRTAISRHFSPVDWSDPANGIYFGEEYSIEFNLRDADLVDSMMLSVRGKGDVIATLFQFAQSQNWSLFDVSTSEFLDPEAHLKRAGKVFRRFESKF